MSFILRLFLLCAGVFAVAADFQCVLIPGKLKQIDAGAGQVYGVNDDMSIFNWMNNTWQLIPGKLIHVTVGPAGVWGIYKDYTVFKLQDNMWKPVTGLLKQVDAGGDKFLGGVNMNDNVFCLNQNCTVSKSSLVMFSAMEGSLKYYSCGAFGCWGINSAKCIFFRETVTSDACQGCSWKQVEGSLTMLEVATDGSVYGINSAGDAFRREGITASTPTGTSWTRLDFCATFKHLTYDAGFLWLLSRSGEIYRCNDVK